MLFSSNILILEIRKYGHWNDREGGSFPQLFYKCKPPTSKSIILQNIYIDFKLYNNLFKPSIMFYIPRVAYSSHRVKELTVEVKSMNLGSGLIKSPLTVIYNVFQEDSDLFAKIPV